MKQLFEDSCNFDPWAKNYRKELQSALGKIASHRLEDYAEVKARLVSQTVKRTLKKNPDKIAICEGGCGIGILTKALSKNFKTLFAWDPSRESCKIARENNPKIEIKEGKSPLKLFGPSSFDCVLLSCVLHHVREGQRPSLLREISKTLKRPGVLVIIEHNPLNPFVVSAVRKCKFDKDAELLSPSDLSLAKPENQKIHISKKYFGFWSQPKTSERFLDSWLGFLPLGAQWLVSAHFVKN